MGKIKAIVEGAKAAGSEAVDFAGDAFGALKNLLNYKRDGAQIADRISDIPSAREVAGLSSIPEAGAFSNIKSEQAELLRNHFSQGYLSNETLPPEQITISDLKGKTLMSIVGDPTGRHTVTNLQGRTLPEPVDSMAGFEYTDIPGQGYAGAKGPTNNKLNEALKTEDPYYTSVMMAEKSGDFAMHTGELFGQMLRNQGNMPLDTKDIPKIDEAIRGMGMPIKVKVKNPDGTEKMVGRTIYPFQSFTTVADPNSVLDFLKTLPTGTLRAAFLKGMDKAGLQKMGIPSVGQTRLALADAEQIGMDWGTTGYRGFVPDLNKGSFPTTAQNSTTYDTGVDKVGRSQSFLDGSRGIPANLLYRDNAAARREAGTGGNLVMNSADYKVLESSPKKAKQLVDDQLDEIISTFTEIERRGGRRASLQYAQELLSGGKITGKMIEAARKANIPSWMLAAIAPSLGALSSMGENKEGAI
tara:strand:+ start:311 stop:1720 length:1410 start_codon:yes stop_codon:yes gene_type:complete